MRPASQVEWQVVAPSSAGQQINSDYPWAGQEKRLLVLVGQERDVVVGRSVVVVVVGRSAFAERSVVVVGRSAFAGRSVVVVGRSAFAGRSVVVVGRSVVVVGRSAFAERSVVVKVVGRSAFAGRSVVVAD